MSDLVQLLPLWRELDSSGVEYVLATVVQVEGSGYRKPGAKMLISADGRRAGTISGGCLEAEVAKKAFWHTEQGPVLRRYSTAADDGDVPFGMGCGGVIHILLERSETAAFVMKRLADAFLARTALSIATILDGPMVGRRAFWPSASGQTSSSGPVLESLARRSYDARQSTTAALEATLDEPVVVRCEWVAPRTGIFIFGAGDDGIPLANQAHQLGWFVAVADSRTHLVTSTRFSKADALIPLPVDEFPDLDLQPTDVAVILTHSLQQDTHILGYLLHRNLAYLGVLGPRRRTRDILTTLAEKHAVSSTRRSGDSVDDIIDTWMGRIHAPMGLDLGGDTPPEIALAILAEIQQTRHRTSGLALRKIRAVNVS